MHDMEMISGDTNACALTYSLYVSCTAGGGGLYPAGGGAPLALCEGTPLALLDGTLLGGAPLGAAPRGTAA